MKAPSNPSRGLLLLGLASLSLAAITRPVEAGGLLHKKGQLVALPTQGQALAIAPVQLQALTLVPVQLQAAPISLVQVQQAAPTWVASPVQLTVAQPTAQVQLQAQAAPAPSPSPTIHITVVESARPQATPTAQAAPQTSAQVQLGAAPVQIATYAAPTVAVPQAVPVQLYYLPPSHKCSIFCRH